MVSFERARRAWKDLPVQPMAAMEYLAWRGAAVPRDVRAWARTNRPRQSPVSQSLPWLNFALIDVLDGWLERRPRRVFEWGAGGSTLYYARRSAAVVTVEHDAVWTARVAAEIRRLGLDTVDLRHVPEDEGTRPLPPPQPPQRAGKLQKYGTYVDQIRTDGVAYDLIQVDGRARVECVAAARDHLAPGGLLVVDDVDKPGRMADVRALLDGGWGVWRTWGPGPSSGARVITAAAVCFRR